MDLVIPDDMTIVAPNPDMSFPMVCDKLLTCANNCQSLECERDCGLRASAHARDLLGALQDCIYGTGNNDGACPNTNGGVCDQKAPGYVYANCEDCVNKAQDRGGACRTELLLCIGDCNTDRDCAGLGCGGVPCTCQDNLCR